jgi:transposase
MPRKQRPETDQLIKTMLGLGTTQKPIAQRAQCSKRQVQRIKHNLLHYGTIRKPKKPQQGRKRFLDDAQEDVCNHIQIELIVVGAP